MQDTLNRLFAFKAWADDALLTELFRHSDKPQLLGPAIQALSHTFVVDQIFAAHLRRRSHAYRSTNLTEPPTLQALAADLRASDRRFIDYVATLSPAQRAETIDFVFTDSAPGRMSREEMLMHVITHGVGHRGQVSALMLLHSQAPAPDGFTRFLHEAEAATRQRTSAQVAAI